MGNYENLKQSITEVIKTNGNQEITGAVLQSTLLTIISSVGANATFAGMATPTTNPGTPDGSVFYLASEGGIYPNFNAIELQDGLSVLMWNGSWSSQQIFGIDDVPTAGSDNLVKSGGVQQELALGAVYDVSAKNPTAGTNNDGKFESLSALLEDANLDTLIPTSVRKGGMSIKFVQSSDNNYKQFRLIADTFAINLNKWQSENVDQTPTYGSKNLISSGGVKNALEPTSKISKQIISEQSEEFSVCDNNFTPILSVKVEEPHEESIEINDNDGNEIVALTSQGVNAKNLKSNGKPVLTTDDIIKNIGSSKTLDHEESVEFTDNNGVAFAKIKENIIQGKSFNLINPSISLIGRKNLGIGEKIELEECHIHGNKKLSFMANISSLTNFKIGIGTTSYWASYFIIDETSIVLKNYTDREITTSVNFNHGITFGNNISVAIAVDNKGNLTIELASNGYKYTGTINISGNITPSITSSYFLGINGKPFIEATNAAFTDAILSFTCNGWNKKIHVYGDSYVNVFDGKRPYFYLAQHDYLENVLLNAFPGEGSLAAIQDLQRNLPHSTPQYIMWAMGMNDLDVSDTVPSVNWLNGVNTLLSECNKRGIVPILCTIPSVIGGYSPDSGIGSMRIHKAKNDWVRNSGYRYIDFAKAVGASDVNGTWFNNGEVNDFLESGSMRVHPTQYGALALYYQILADFPEIINN